MFIKKNFISTNYFIRNISDHFSFCRYSFIKTIFSSNYRTRVIDLKKTFSLNAEGCYDIFVGIEFENIIATSSNGLPNVKRISAVCLPLD